MFNEGNEKELVSNLDEIKQFLGKSIEIWLKLKMTKRRSMTREFFARIKAV